MTAPSRWHDLTLGDPPCYLLRGPEQPCGTYFGPPWAALGERAAKVSVISPARGGEVRGYWLLRGALWVAHPVYPLDWSELDSDVARATGLEVKDHAVDLMVAHETGREARFHLHRESLDNTLNDGIGAPGVRIRFGGGTP